MKILEILVTIGIFNSTCVALGGSGFNEQFIVASFDQATLDAQFPAVPSGNFDPYLSLRNPDAPKIPVWQDANYYINRLKSSGVNEHREILDLAYLAPNDPNQHPFDEKIASILYIYKYQGMKLILAFSVNGSSGNLITEPKWIKDRQSPTGSAYQRLDLYSTMIADFVLRMKNNYFQGDPGWVDFLNNSLIIEPLNEVNNFFPGAASFPSIVAFLDTQVKTKLSQRGFSTNVIASSIETRMGDWGTVAYWWAYYGGGGTARPNIHLYQLDSELNNFSASIVRWESTVNFISWYVGNPATGHAWQRNQITIGEVGVNYRNADQSINLSHNTLISSVRGSTTLASTERFLFWRLFGGYLNASCYEYACGPLQNQATTFGFYRLASPGDPWGHYPTQLLIENELKQFYPGFR